MTTGPLCGHTVKDQSKTIKPVFSRYPCVPTTSGPVVTNALFLC